MLRRVLPALVTASLVVSITGCDKPTDDNIDKWMGTEHGPDKLKAAFANDSLDPALSAHAGINMIKKGMDNDVVAALPQMAPARRAAVLALIVPQLWDLARVQGEMTMPSPRQIAAKDGLVTIRKYADDKTRTTIDGYLLDWYTAGFYEGRATLGMHRGPEVMRLLAPNAGKNLIASVNSTIAAPPKGTKLAKIGDEILLGLAASCSPDAVQHLLEIAHMDRGDPSLSSRAIHSLHLAYVDAGGQFDLCDKTGLVPNLDNLVALAKDDSVPHGVTNDTVDLIKVTGAPTCVAPLLAMVSAAHRDLQYRYTGAAAALACGGPAAIGPVADAFPDTAYDHLDIGGAVWSVITTLSPRDKVLAALRDLLTDKNRVARWIGIEGLAAMKSTEDAPKIAALGKDPARLTGYWGEGSGKADPTLGQRATELAAQLSQPTPPVSK